MTTSFTCNRRILELAKNDDHFVLVYPNTPAGRMAARRAVRNWLIDCELAFDRNDAAMLWQAIGASCFHARFGRCSKRGMGWGR